MKRNLAAVSATRRQFNQGVLAIGASAATTNPVWGKSNADEAYFPFGTHIYREPSLPLSQLTRDIPILSRLGFNLIKIQEVWSYDEPHEGEVHTEKIERLLAACDAARMRVYLGLTMEAAPAWLWRKFPDATMVYEDGTPNNDPAPYVLPGDGKPGPTWFHPGVRDAAARFLTTLVSRLGRHDAIGYWNVWQEIGTSSPNRPGHLGLSYDPYTLAEYRKWLQRKYGTIDSLNAAWATPFGSWDEIDPPRLTPNVPANIDFRVFMDLEYLPFALRFKRDCVKRADVKLRPVFAHIGTVTSVGATHEWAWSRTVDFFGTSCYPAWEGFNPWDAEQGLSASALVHASRYHELWRGVLFEIDYVRSATPEGRVWAAELQGGPISQNFRLGRVPDAADIQRWCFGLLAAGARGISFWNHRPEILLGELEGFSLLDSQGDTTPRAVEAGRISRALNRHAKIFGDGARVAPEIAIVVNERLYHLFESVGDTLEHYKYTICGLYRSLFERGFGVDFIDIREIASKGGAYKPLILPMPFSLGLEDIGTLQSYVAAGGHLLSEAGPGRMNEFGIGYNQGGMAEPLQNLFGARSLGIRNIREPQDGSRWAGGIRKDDTISYSLLTGTSRGVAPANYLQFLQPTSAEVTLTLDGSPVGVRNRYGKGDAWLTGTLLGHAILAYGDDRNADFLETIAGQAGVKADRVGRLIRFRRRLGSSEAWFLINRFEEPVSEQVPTGQWRIVERLLGGALQAAEHAPVVVPGLGIECLIVTR